jgi:hypothetical protein
MDLGRRVNILEAREGGGPASFPAPDRPMTHRNNPEARRAEGGQADDCKLHRESISAL